MIYFIHKVFFHSSSQWASPKAALFNLAALRQLFSFKDPFMLPQQQFSIEAANGPCPRLLEG
jgi:hypothetical protein